MEFDVTNKMFLFHILHNKRKQEILLKWSNISFVSVLQNSITPEKHSRQVFLGFLVNFL